MKLYYADVEGGVQEFLNCEHLYYVLCLKFKQIGN